MIRIKYAGAALAVVGAVVLTGCSSSSEPSGGSTGSGTPAAQEVTILQNWFASPEQGGYWQTAAEGLGKDAGVNITVKPGGPGIQTVPQVAAGAATFGVGNADEVMQARQSGLPIVAVFAPLDLNPQCMMSHKESNITSFPQLNGHTVQRVPSPYWDYLKTTFKLDDVKEVNYTGLADFKRNEDMVMQCYETNTPYFAQKENIPVNVLSVARDGGYNPYAEIMFTTEQQIQDNPEMVKAVVAAVAKGWQNFATDPAAGEKAILESSDENDADSFKYAWQTMKDNNYFSTSNGGMTDDRLKTLRDQLATIGVVPADFDYSKAFDSQFVPTS